MLDQDHPAFDPPSDNCSLWRYQDFTKLVAMLETKQLVLSRADQFEDPYEGVLSEATMSDLARETSSVPRQVAEFMPRSIAAMREQVFVSCWFSAEHESAAMWKLYLQSREGIAIRTDVEALREVLDRDHLIARIGKVAYVDYATTVFSLDNAFYPFLHKRMSFAHEREVRAIVWANEKLNRWKISEGAKIVGIPIDPNQLIKKVYVCPTAPQWFGTLVEQVSRRYGLNCPIERSSLYDRPTY